MSIWILQPDQNGTCCACGVRQNPCDFCTNCLPILFDQNYVPGDPGSASLLSPFQSDYGNLLVRGGGELGAGGVEDGAFIVQSIPTGIIYKNNGVSTSINFTNNNSKLQTVSS